MRIFLIELLLKTVNMLVRDLHIPLEQLGYASRFADSSNTLFTTCQNNWLNKHKQGFPCRCNQRTGSGSILRGSSVQLYLWPTAQQYCSSYHAAQTPEVFVHTPFFTKIYCQKSYSSTDRDRHLQKPQKKYSFMYLLYYNAIQSDLSPRCQINN